VAPSWGEKNCLGYCGTDFLLWLLEAGYQVILRPHPFSLKAEAAFIHELRGRFALRPSLEFDLNVDGSPSLARADLMISDKSGVRFDFAFLYERPVITLDIPIKNREYFEISELDFVWEEHVETELGPVLSVDAFSALDAGAFLALTKRTLHTEPSRIASVRDRSVANFGRAGIFIADWVINKCRDLSGSRD
jgi:hypothetical protein